MHPCKYLLASFVLLLSVATRADESYDFHRINCDSYIPALEVEYTTYWNIRNLVWPEKSTHAEALQRLEVGSQLYVLHGSHGHYVKPSLSWSCGPIRATVRVERLVREEVGTPTYFPAHPRLSVYVGQELILSAMYLSPQASVVIRRVRVYLDSQASVLVELLAGAENQEVNFLPTEFPVTAEKLKLRLAK